MVTKIKEDEATIKKRWKKKRSAIYNLADNIKRLKRQVHNDLNNDEDEKEQLTALVIRILLKTSERIGNDDSGSEGHFGITQFRMKHISFQPPSTVAFNYVGKSGVKHYKEFSDATTYKLLKKLWWRDNIYVFTTYDGFRIRPDKVNRYLDRFGMKSKDIRGFNSNKMMLEKLSGISIQQSERKKVFNKLLREVAAKIGHLPTTLRKHYLLPEIEQEYYNTGRVKKVKI